MGARLSGGVAREGRLGVERSCRAGLTCLDSRGAEIRVPRSHAPRATIKPRNRVQVDGKTIERDNPFINDNCWQDNN